MKQTENSEKAENGCGKTSRRYCRYCGAKCDGSCPRGTQRIKLQRLWFPRCLTKASSWSFNPKRNGSWPWGSKGNKLKGLYLLFLYCLTIASRRSCSPKCTMVAVRNCDMIYVQLGYKPRLLLISTDLAKDPSTSLPGCTRLDDMTLGLSKDDFGQAVSIFHQLLGIGYSIVATVAVVAGHPGGLLRLLRAAPPRAARHLGHLQPLRGPRHRGLYNRCATSINIWVNYNDLTATSLEIIVSKGNHPKMALIQVSEIL